MKLEHVETFLELNHYIPENQAHWIIERVKKLTDALERIANMYPDESELIVPFAKNALKDENNNG
jgi:hypothetical protein